MQQRIVAETWETLAELVAELPRPLVFTNGCFDILHRGHVDYLEQARELGESLVVGINTDASVRRLDKGSERPLNPLDDRMAILAALRAINLVVAFDDDTPLSLIKQVQPDVLVKGGDWSVDRIVGADVVRDNGGEVRSIPFRFDRSTTSLVDRIRDS